MLLIYTKAGDCVEVKDAVRVKSDMGMLLCYDTHGQLLRAVDADNVTLYTLGDETIELMKEDA